MKVLEAIYEADALNPNTYPVQQKVRWLSRLDLRVQCEVIGTHEDGVEPYTGYERGDINSELDRELLVGEPFCEMYVHWLTAQIAYCNREIAGFNAANAMFEAVYGDFRRQYHAAHRPKSSQKCYY